MTRKQNENYIKNEKVGKNSEKVLSSKAVAENKELFIQIQW